MDRQPAPGNDARIALVHEWLALHTGSENTFEQIALAFPDADLYALSHDPATRFDFGGRSPTTTFLDNVHLRERRALTLPIMPVAWKRVDVPATPYDLVVTSSHAFANFAKPTRDAKTVLCYCYTPARYLWVPELEGERSRFDAILGPARSVLKRVDRRGAARVTEFAAISTEIKSRIRRFYGRDSYVIPPPVNVKFFASDEAADLTAEERTALPDGEFIFAISRFIPYKRLDLAIEAAAWVGIPIVVAGSGPDEARLRAVAESTGHDVSFVHRPSQQLLRELYRRARLLVFPAHEDFGIVPLEAQAAGTPVVGYAAGGSLDTIRPGETGELADRQDVTSFAEAITRALDGVASDPETAGRCRDHAGYFSDANFRRRITAWVAEHTS